MKRGTLLFPRGTQCAAQLIQTETIPNTPPGTQNGNWMVIWTWKPFIHCIVTSVCDFICEFICIVFVSDVNHVSKYVSNYLRLHLRKNYERETYGVNLISHLEFIVATMNGPSSIPGLSPPYNFPTSRIHSSHSCLPHHWADDSQCHYLHVRMCVCGRKS